MNTRVGLTPVARPYQANSVSAVKALAINAAPHNAVTVRAMRRAIITRMVMAKKNSPAIKVAALTSILD